MGSGGKSERLGSLSQQNLIISFAEALSTTLKNMARCLTVVARNDIAFR